MIVGHCSGPALISSMEKPADQPRGNRAVLGAGLDVWRIGRQDRWP
jgi:hypothetical protein